MIIQCPACKTKFNIKIEVFGERMLVKLQCSRCKTIFRYDRTSSTVAGIEKTDFYVLPSTQASAAPKQEAYESFERREEPRAADLAGQMPTDSDVEAALDAQLSHGAPREEPPPREEAAPPAPPVVEAPPAPEEPAAPAQPEGETAAPPDGGTAEGPSTSIVIDGVPSFPGTQAELAAAQTAAQTAREVEAIKKEAAGHEEEKHEITQKVRVTTKPAPRDPFGGDTFVLQLEDVYEEAPVVAPSRRGRALGILAIVVLVLGAAFYLFVTGRNGWRPTILFTEPREAVLVAFAEAERLEVAPEARDLETAVTEVYQFAAPTGGSVLAVAGEVFNPTVFPKQRIRVHVELADVRGDAVATAEALAGITLLPREKVVEKTYSGLTMYLDQEQPTADRWVVNSQRKVSFQAFFPNPPAGADDPERYRVTATAVAAANALSGE